MMSNFSKLLLHNLVRKLFLWFFTSSIIEGYDSFLAINSMETVGPWKSLTLVKLLPRQICSELHGLRQVLVILSLVGVC